MATITTIEVTATVEIDEVVKNIPTDIIVSEVIDRSLTKEQKDKIYEEYSDDFDDNDISLNSFLGTEEIQWSAPNLMDQMVMEALQDAYKSLTPAQIIERLKV